MASERRKKKRINLPRPLFARFATMGVIILDITDVGARIEHFNHLDARRTAPLRLEWEKKPIEVTAQVKSCKVHRFAADEIATVYQSGLFFTEYAGDAQRILKDLVSTIVARSLAEQVANARGIGPVLQTEMPVFRAGVVADAPDRGYLRCTFINGRWEKKWSRTPEQPLNGFTVPATEPAESVDQLCETYRIGTDEDRKLILLMAQLSVSK